MIEEFANINAKFPKLNIYYEWSNKWNVYLIYFMCDKECETDELDSRIDLFAVKMMNLFDDNSPLISMNNEPIKLSETATLYSVLAHKNQS